MYMAILSVYILKSCLNWTRRDCTDTCRYLLKFAPRNKIPPPRKENSSRKWTIPLGNWNRFASRKENYAVISNNCKIKRGKLRGIDAWIRGKTRSMFSRCPARPTQREDAPKRSRDSTAPAWPCDAIGEPGSSSARHSVSPQHRMRLYVFTVRTLLGKTTYHGSSRSSRVNLLVERNLFERAKTRNTRSTESRGTSRLSARCNVSSSCSPRSVEIDRSELSVEERKVSRNTELRERKAREIERRKIS